MGSFSYWHWIILIVFVGGIIAAIVAASRRNKDQSVAGVGGWLVIPIIGFIGVVGLTSFNLFGAFQEIEGIKAIFFGETEELRGLALPIGLSILFALLVIISALTCLYKIFVSKRDLRKFAVFHYCLLVAAMGAEFWGDRELTRILPEVAPDPNAPKDFGRAIWAAMVWIPYFLVSKRVKNTFESDSATTGVANASR